MWVVPGEVRLLRATCRAITARENTNSQLNCRIVEVSARALTQWQMRLGQWGGRLRLSVIWDDGVSLAF